MPRRSSEEERAVSRSLHFERARLRKSWQEAARTLPLCRGPWRYSRNPQADDPPQGWKIHLSATIRTAREVFTRALPVLRKRGVLFKVPARLEFLVALNSGLAQFSQVGKFLTAYPRSETEALALARELHEATRDLEGPQVPFDVRYRKQGILSYRYGAFRGADKSGAGGTIVDTAGRIRMDVRDRAHAVPRWIKDPLSGHRERKIEARLPNPFGIDLLPLKAITKRGKGSVYKALDLSVLPARFVIVKEGLRHGETNWLGLDGFAQIKHEGTILRHLRKAGVPVPAVFREFTRDKNRYLVLEMIRGRPLLSRGGLQPQKKSWKQVELLLRRISAALATIHRAGYVWRDCKPEHIFCWRGDIRFVDFEGACRIDEVDAPPWATSAYSPPSCHRALTRQRGTLEDDYALGVIAFQFGTGKLPPASARSRITLYKRTKCPSALRAKIEQWLTPKISRRLVK